MRSIKLINDNWTFQKEGQSTVLSLPHTYNGTDGQDGGNDYYRGTVIYKKTFQKDELTKDGKVAFVEFEGVNSSCKVFFNDKLLKSHEGGYSAFRVELCDIKDENELKVEVSNEPNDHVYPQNADFTFYGGIYRDVKLINTSKKHFELDYFGTPGIKVTPKIEGKDASVTIETYCDYGEVEFEIFDGERSVSKETVTGKNPSCTLKIESVHLWNGRKDPHLYKAVARLKDGDCVADDIEAAFGVRKFKIDPQKGFILNGESYPLRGVSRHQDRPQIGNALKHEHHEEDIDLICEMGANTIRLAHYQHNQYFYDLCDQKGLIIWAEIPYISTHLKNGVENTKSQMTELIVQNYNHPSIVVWGLSNEITMGGSNKDIIDNHNILNDLAHSLDKTRPTTLAALTVCDIDDPYVHISDVLSYNHYFGWYGGNVNMYGGWFDSFHKKYPNRAIGLSEYGCEALNWHTSDPKQGDYTEEYQAHYHEELIKQIADRPYLWATHVWNMFDFAADARAEGGENGMNHKGLVTFDRKYKKDAFYAYKAWLNPEPMVHICSKRYVDRTEDVTNVTVYSNCDSVELFANGKSVQKQQKGKFPFFYFKVENVGETTLTAKAGNLQDESHIKKVSEPNESYIMKEEGAVINWFEINTPPGKLSVNDTIGDILKTLSGKIAAAKIIVYMLKQMKKAKKNGEEKESKGPVDFKSVKISKSMIEMVKGFSIKRGVSMVSGMFTKEDILKINDILNKVKKK